MNITETYNIATMTDSYKVSHWKGYNPEINYMQSYLESRKDDNSDILFFGLQYIIRKYLTGRVVTVEDVLSAKNFWDSHFGRTDVFNMDGWMYIANELNGRLPVNIWALPEGTVSKSRTPLMVIESTDKNVPWVVNWLETLISQIWYPTTVATNSYNIKQDIKKFLLKTSDLSDEAFDMTLLTRLHDFGYRGVSSVEQAGVGGMSHLINFIGTDTARAIETIQTYYPGDSTVSDLGISIPATEHSTMSSQGEGSLGEKEVMERWLDTFPEGIIACVSDTYDIIRAIKDYWGGELKDKVLSRDGVLVVRPDSGDPEVTTIKVFEALWESFGGHVNSKGYKVLNDKVRMIQGDGIDATMVRRILRNFDTYKISTENIAFGSGGGLLQKFDRDTFKFAFKLNMVKTNDGQTIDVRKFPKEFNSFGNYVDSFKYSKSGNLIYEDTMRMVYSNGKLLAKDSFKTVRDRASRQ